jgi:hypothetical protein
VRPGNTLNEKGGNRTLLQLLSQLQPEREQLPRGFSPNLTRKMLLVNQKKLNRKKSSPNPQFQEQLQQKELQ